MALLDRSVEKRVRLKLDFILLPFLSILFLFNSLDKSNIGSAETGNFTKESGIPASALNNSVACFFAAFVSLQPIGAALGRRYGMARYVPVCMTLWGLCTTLHIFVTKQWQLVLLRTCVGILEAGFYPTTVSYLSLFYTRFEFAKRLGIFYGMAAISGALGGLLSWAVFSQFPGTTPSESPHPPGLHDVAVTATTGWKGWQVLFLIEGLSTMAIASLGFFWLPHNASTAWFFNKIERVTAEARISQDRAIATAPTSRRPSKTRRDDESHEDDSPQSSPRLSHDNIEHEHLIPRSTDLSQSFLSTRTLTDDRGLSKSDITSALLDWKVWFLLACNILSALPALAFSIFLPLVIKGLVPSDADSNATGDLAPATANLLTVPPFIAGALILWLFTTWSDRSQQRLVPILCGLVILMTGLIATLLTPASAYKSRYVALVVLLSGSFVPSPLTVAWLAGNIPEPGKRAVVLGINGWGNLAGVVSALVFAPSYRESGYMMPFFITLGCVGIAFLGFAGFRLLVGAVNVRRAEAIAEWDDETTARESESGDVQLQEYPLTAAWWLPGAGRRVRDGDERLTFVYGL